MADGDLQNWNLLEDIADKARVHANKRQVWIERVKGEIQKLHYEIEIGVGGNLPYQGEVIAEVAHIEQRIAAICDLVAFDFDSTCGPDSGAPSEGAALHARDLFQAYLPLATRVAAGSLLSDLAAVAKKARTMVESRGAYQRTGRPLGFAGKTGIDGLIFNLIVYTKECGGDIRTSRVQIKPSLPDPPCHIVDMLKQMRPLLPPSRLDDEEQIARDFRPRSLSARKPATRGRDRQTANLARICEDIGTLANAYLSKTSTKKWRQKSTT